MIISLLFLSFQAICKLFGGPSAAIMCVAVDTQEDCDYVFAGSKDHYIKASTTYPFLSHFFKSTD